jgi:ribosome assembly protein YihI (activator of Der GTPase)
MKIIEKTFNVETGEETIIERDETSAETKERLDYAKELAAKQAEADAKVAAKEAVLEKLGLSAEEVAALLG